MAITHFGWKTTRELAAERNDHQVGREKRKKKTKKELARELNDAGITALEKWKMDRLRPLAVEHGIDLHKVERKLSRGWMNNQKGLLQMLWERGWIATEDEEGNQINPRKYYTMDGPKDKYGETIKERSLKYLASQLYDFANERTSLQALGETLGATVDRTPKCHPEMAGEGIEYSWGCGKNRYRHLPINQRKTKEDFFNSVRSCMNSAAITRDMIRRFSRRARRYMVCYYKLAKGLVEGGEYDTLKQDGLILQVEKLLKECKTHRCAMDFDTKFIVESMK